MKTPLILSFVIFSSSIFAQSSQQKTDAFTVENKTVTVYTTANETALRLSETEKLQFKTLKQPFETQPCVFIDPSKTFQTFIGIGGSMSDASAETFFKLSPEVQQEFLTAYYDKEKGIGYTLGRTNIA